MSGFKKDRFSRRPYFSKKIRRWLNKRHGPNCFTVGGADYPNGSSALIEGFLQRRKDIIRAGLPAAYHESQVTVGIIGCWQIYFYRGRAFLEIGPLEIRSNGPKVEAFQEYRYVNRYAGSTSTTGE